ncbi:MAG: hypothetical protein QOD82_5317, partial [Pseudonocardiales bacterium]|nr:hypothetical protein [Pseudonocardiales bacterium]
MVAAHISLSSVGSLVTGYGVTVAVASLPIAHTTRRITRRHVLPGLLAVLVLGSWLSVLGSSYPVLLTARVATAVAQAFFWAVMGPVQRVARGLPAAGPGSGRASPPPEGRDGRRIRRGRRPPPPLPGFQCPQEVAEAARRAGRAAGRGSDGVAVGAVDATAGRLQGCHQSAVLARRHRRESADGGVRVRPEGEVG